MKIFFDKICLPYFNQFMKIVVTFWASKFYRNKYFQSKDELALFLVPNRNQLTYLTSYLYPFWVFESPVAFSYRGLLPELASQYEGFVWREEKIRPLPRS